MSCLLNTYGKITNLNNIINFLTPNELSNNDEIISNESDKIYGKFFFLNQIICSLISYFFRRFEMVWRLECQLGCK